MNLEQIKAELKTLAIKAKELQDAANQIHDQGEKLKQKGHFLTIKSMVGQSVTLSDWYCEAYKMRHLKSISAVIKGAGPKNAQLDFSNGDRYSLPLDSVLYHTGLANDGGARDLDLQSVYQGMFPRKK